MRTILTLVLVTLLSTPAVEADHPTEFTRSTATVVAWNLAGFSQIPRETVPNFIPTIRDLDAEILALVEVNTDFVAAEIAAEFNDLDVCYKRKILSQSATQNIALLHKCNVQITNPRLIAGSDNGNSNLRRALALDLIVGDFDALLIVVHMKAGRSNSDRAVRDNQAAAIAAFIQAETTGSEQDVLVVGDYNMIPVQDQSNFDAMSPGNFLRFVSSEDLVGEFSHISSSGNPGNLLDGFAVSRDHTREYIAGSLRVFPIHRALGLSLLDYRNQVSDHLPIVARFRITADDD